MRRIGWIAAGLSVLIALAAAAAQSATAWNQPAAALAEQIASIVGPGQVNLTVRNLSTISSEDISAIRQLLERDLKAHGVQISGAESANTIRVTLSEDTRERLWVAEVVEGNQTQVAMVRLDRSKAEESREQGGLLLRRDRIFTGPHEILAALAFPAEIVVLEPEFIAFYSRAPQGWSEQRRVSIGQKRPLPRDPRGILVPGISGTGFDAWLAATHCAGEISLLQDPNSWPIHCDESDDPWPVATTGGTLSGFYNANRNYFTGIVTPSPGAELPPFYSAAWTPRPLGGSALLIDGIDAKVQMLENGSLKSVSGTRDWGSDFAVLTSGCGMGAQVIVSASGEAASDSLRAYELPTMEAVAVSAPLAMNGTVTVLWTAPDGKSVLAVVRAAADQYEVDRVTALCN